jgi:hypothetical protein
MSNEKIDKKELELRIEDWERRILSLYATVKKWIKSADNYCIKQTASFRMNEELMQEFKIKPKTLDVLDIYYRNALILTIKPVALWVIAANGRLDILYKTGSAILIDRAKPLHDPEWVVFSPRDRKNGSPFNENFFLRLLKSLS